MSLIEYTIDGKIDKVELALQRIKLANLSEEPLYVCYSGGKDSKVLRRLMEMSEVPHELHYNLTTVDHPEIVRELIDDKDVIIDKARYADGKQKTMWNLIVKKQFPPTQLFRYCCAELKESGGMGRICVTGVRKAESARRKEQGAIAKIFEPSNVVKIHNLDNDDNRRMVEQCYRTRKTLINPILDWTDEDVWEFSKIEGIKQNPLYKQCGGNKTRIGCLLCPMASKEQRQREAREYPKIAEAYVKAFDRMIKAMSNAPRWKSGQEVFEWWIDGIYKDKVDDNQFTIDDLEF